MNSAKTLILLTSSLAASLVIAEAVAKLYLRTRESSSLAIFEAVAPAAGDDVLAVKSNHFQLWRSSEFAVEVQTNSEGFRESFDFELDAVDVAFAGDSFTFGHGVRDGERYSDRFADLFPDELVVSLAYKNGFAPPHYLYFFQRHETLSPRLVVLGLYLGNDLEGDIRETETLFDDKGRIASLALIARGVSPEGELINSARSYKAGFDWLRSHSRLGRLLITAIHRSRFRSVLFGERIGFVPNQPNSKALEFGRLGELARRSLATVQALDRLVRARGGRLLVFLIPQSFYAGDYRNVHVDRSDTSNNLTPSEIDSLRVELPLQSRLRVWCSDTGIPCLDPTQRFRELELAGQRLYYRRDGHWTAAGHAAAAEMIGSFRNRTAPGSSPRGEPREPG